MMIADWFHDRLQHSGHVRLESLRGRLDSRLWYTAEIMLSQLWRRHEFRHVVSIYCDEQSVSRSEDIMRVIEEEEIDFGPWTSFRDEHTIYFVFRVSDSALRFKLLLPD